ncbi:MAG: efflux RND transporter periplasmic adaptor subunit [Carboxylicivirga sp.]|nr:efflux RND transporter periplasmic adaptor subunit [Carboxylicivirga sp.]
MKQAEIKDNMDRAIPIHQIRKRQAKVWGIALAGIALVLFIIIYGIGLVKPKFTKGSYKTACVQRGTVCESIMAMGRVENEREVLILSPVNSKLMQIVRAPGSEVLTNDTILRLESKSLERQIALQEDQLMLKENSFYQNKLNIRNEALELVHELEIKSMNITALATRLSEEKQLLEVGGISEERVRKTEQELSLAEKELVLAEKQHAIRKEKQVAEQRALELEIQMQKKEIEELYVKLDATTVCAQSNGVIISIVGKEGEIIGENQELVRISNLNAFKITGQISDSQAGKIKSGGRVLAINNKTQLEGLIGNIRPEVQNGQVKFDVFLKQNNHPLLRPNLQVELQLIISERNDVLRLPDGPYFDGSKKLQVFKIDQHVAKRVEVEVGLSNFENIEIKSGLQEGDEVIISDVSKYEHLEEVKINNQ